MSLALAWKWTSKLRRSSTLVINPDTTGNWVVSSISKTAA